MAKRIVFCTDGTWDTPRMNDNVYRLYKALLVTADQVTFYDDGVGADTTGLDHIVGGAFGQGLIQKVQDAYTKIAHVYETGDKIYLFGFSRGAFTARSIAGMIATCGLPTGSFTDDCVTKTFQAYRDPTNRAQLLAGLGVCGLVDATIQMVGVWGYGRIFGNSCHLRWCRRKGIRFPRYGSASRRKECLSGVGCGRAARPISGNAVDVGACSRPSY